MTSYVKFNIKTETTHITIKTETKIVSLPKINLLIDNKTVMERRDKKTTHIV